MPARKWFGKDLAMNSARRGQPAFLSITISSISTMRAGGKAPGNDEVARGEGESRCSVEAEVALDVAVRVPTVGKVQYVVVVALMDERRIVNLYELLITVIVGQRDEQVERLAGGEQRGVGALRRAHGCHRVVHQAGHHAPVERWL